MVVFQKIIRTFAVRKSELGLHFIRKITYKNYEHD